MRNKPKFFGLDEECDVISSLLARADKRSERRPQLVDPAALKPQARTPTGRR